MNTFLIINKKKDAGEKKVEIDLLKMRILEQKSCIYDLIQSEAQKVDSN